MEKSKMCRLEKEIRVKFIYHKRNRKLLTRKMMSTVKKSLKEQ